MPHGSRDSSYGHGDAFGNADPVDEDLSARSEQWQRTGDPSSLWPGLDLVALDHAARAIESSVALALDARRSSLGQADGADARAIGIAALILGVGPLLGYWVERGLLDVSDPLAAVLGSHLFHGRRRVNRIANGVRPVVKAMAAVGITPVVIKGFHAAHAYFPEPGVRPLADVDLVVSPAEIGEAERVLSLLGFVGGPTRQPYKRVWVPPDVDGRIRSFDLWHSDNQWLVELHGGLFFSDLHRYGVNFETTESVVSNMDGIEARVLPPPLCLVATAAHLSAELFVSRLVRLIEMILAIRSQEAAKTLDWAAVEDVLDRTRATRFVYPAFALIERLAPDTVPSRVLDRARRASSRLGRYVVAQVGPATPLLSNGTSVAEVLMWPSGPAEFVDRIGRLLASDMSSWAEARRVYECRLRRLFTGRMSVGFRR